jgi:excisionase family DNA binding protein
VDPEVQGAARDLAARLATDPGNATQVNRIVRFMLSEVADGRRVILVRADAEVTPTRAAEMIGVSRQFVDRLLADGVLAYRRLPGSKHRRIKVAEVVELTTRREREGAGHAAIPDALADADLLHNA